jgi:hypothetical protein
VLTVSRWASIETPRLVALAMAALFENGAKNPRDHLALLAAGPVATLLVAKDGLTAEDVQRLDALSVEKGFFVTAVPGRDAALVPIENILSMSSRSELERRTRTPVLDLRPPTDDRPFFFNVVRFGAIGKELPIETAGAIEGNLLATRTLGLAFFASIALVVGAIGVPLGRRARPEGKVDRRLGAGLLYFAIIGVGFMLAEIALLQRLSLLLGHPSYSLLVVLSSLVGAMGVGAFLSDKLPLDRRPWCFVYPVVLAAIVAIVAFAWPALSSGIARATTGTRIGFAIAVSASLGSVLGCAFPVGMRLCRRAHDSETPWLWGINGVGSVLASSLAILIALTYGLTILLAVSAALYLLLVPAVFVLTQTERPSS